MRTLDKVFDVRRRKAENDPLGVEGDLGPSEETLRELVLSERYDRTARLGMDVFENANLTAQPGVARSAAGALVIVMRVMPAAKASRRTARRTPR